MTTSWILPGRGVMTATVSARNTASEMEWVTSRVVVARSCQIRCSSRLSRWRVISSRAPKGSSSSRILGSTTSERAMATRWRMPPESCDGRAFSKPSRPTSLMRSAMVCWETETPETSNGSLMLDITLRHGSRAESWKAMPRWFCLRATCGASPCTRASPAVGFSRSARMRRMVDLPHPEGPSRATKAPAGAPKDTLSRAVMVDRPILNCLVRPRRAIPSSVADDVGVAAGVEVSLSTVSICLGGHQLGGGLELRVLGVDLVEQRHVEELLGGDRRCHRGPACRSSPS